MRYVRPVRNLSVTITGIVGHDPGIPECPPFKGIGHDPRNDRSRSCGIPTVSVALASVQTALRLLAKRWTVLNEELCELDAKLARLTKKAAPRLLDRFGVGPQTAATLLVAAGDNPTRLHSEAALAALCGTSPLQASSGKTQRHRLNRGANRQANNALWTIAMVRMRSDARTRQYVERRTGEGLSKKEIHRCLKRYIVRELYPLILADLKDAAFIA